MRKISNEKIYGLEESVKASAYPMMTEGFGDNSDLTEKDLKRAKVLGNAKSGSGHDCMLKGIIVQFDWTTPVLMQPQIQRYHFIDIISSQSAMHRLTKVDLDKSFTEKTDFEIVNRIKYFITMYNRFDWLTEDMEDIKTVNICHRNEFGSNEENSYTKKELWDLIVHSCPQGLLKTARYSTNYLQLKTMYNQRVGHKLSEWSEFRDWCETLPYFKEFCLKERKE